MQRGQDEKENFYEKLGSCVAAAKDDFPVILGDLIACVGNDWKAWPKAWQTWCWKYESQWFDGFGVLHQIRNQRHRHDVPTKRLLKQQMATSTLK